MQSASSVYPNLGGSRRGFEHNPGSLLPFKSQWCSPFLHSVETPCASPNKRENTPGNEAQCHSGEHPAGLDGRKQHLFLFGENNLLGQVPMAIRHFTQDQCQPDERESWQHKARVSWQKLARLKKGSLATSGWGTESKVCSSGLAVIELFFWSDKEIKIKGYFGFFFF